MLALILAGGASSRMGEDKAWLVYRQQPEIQRIYELLSRYCREVFISLKHSSLERNPNYSSFPLIFDKNENNQPIIDPILDAIESRADQRWLICCCDLPLLDSACIEKLLAFMQTAEQQAYCYHISDQTFEANPVLFLWNALGADHISQIRNSKEKSIKRLLFELSPIKLKDDQNQLVQANTQEDKAEIKNRLHARTL